MPARTDPAVTLNRMLADAERILRWTARYGTAEQVAGAKKIIDQCRKTFDAFGVEWPDISQQLVDETLANGEDEQ